MSLLARLKRTAEEALGELELGRNAERARNLALLWRRERPAVGATAADVVHRENKWQLLRYRARGEGRRYRTPVLLVPSLINRHYVLDLAPGRSFVEYLLEQGHDIFMLDWGRPGDEDRFLTFDDLTGTYLGRALRIAARSSPRGQAHLLGYCLGGTLATIHAAAHPQHVASLTVLAAPVKFDAEGSLRSWTNTESFDVQALVRAMGNVPWPLLQLSFHMLRPTLGLSKAVHLLDRAWDDEYLDGFLALETWGNDNVSFPGAAYAHYIESLYRGDALVKGELRLRGRPVRLRDITCPTLVISFQHDNIVPEPSAAPLVELVGTRDKQHLSLSGGHVGAVVSRKAAERLWPTMSRWWAARDGAKVRATSRR